MRRSWRRPWQCIGGAIYGLCIVFEAVGAAKPVVLEAKLLPMCVLAKVIKFRATFSTCFCTGSPFHYALAERCSAVGAHTSSGRHCCCSRESTWYGGERMVGGKRETGPMFYFLTGPISFTSSLLAALFCRSVGARGGASKISLPPLGTFSSKRATPDFL